MTEEIKYYKEKEYPLKWIPAEEMEETPQQTIDRLERENRELKEECVNLKSLIWYINCSGEIETVDCVISEYYESRNTQYEKGFWKKVCALKGKDEFKNNYRSALEKIKNILNETLETHRITVALAKIRDIIDEVFKYGKA